MSLPYKTRHIRVPRVPKVIVPVGTPAVVIKVPMVSYSDTDLGFPSFIVTFLAKV